MKMIPTKSCWFHKFTKWSEPGPGQISMLGRPWKNTIVQSRTCTNCNRHEMRQAS